MFPRSVVIASILCCITFDGRGADGADVDIICPATFKDNQKNTITCVINSNAIANANCAVTPKEVNFNLKNKNEQSSSSACSETYPCTTTSDPSTSTPCTCTDKTSAGIFTYTFLFAANKTLHEKGTFTCTVCAGSVVDGQENCDSLNFESKTSDDGLSCGSIAAIVFAVLLVGGLSVVAAICCCLEKSDSGLSGGAIAGIVIVAVVVVGFGVVAAIYCPIEG